SLENTEAVATDKGTLHQLRLKAEELKNKIIEEKNNKSNSTESNSSKKATGSTNLVDSVVRVNVSLLDK
ncbi:hypothetical protein, partial [Bacteriovorax sp. DB6_IX]